MLRASIQLTVMDAGLYYRIFVPLFIQSRNLRAGLELKGERARREHRCHDTERTEQAGHDVRDR
jgi:hypothetical protein